MRVIEVSIIIVNYNTFDLTVECIKSIIGRTKEVVFEIILIDNNSNECSPQKFKKLFPEVILIENQENLGFGIANNQGMKVAKGKFIVLLNSDTYLLNEAIDVAVNYANQNPSYSIFGATLLNEDFTLQKSYFETIPINLKSCLKQGFVLSNPLLKKMIKPKAPSNEVGGLFGAYIFLRREVFETTGGFDPDFFMYCEDTEWFRNRIKNNFKIAISQNSKIVHLVSKSSKNKLVNEQNVLSYYLYWYKLKKLYFFCFVTGSYLNSLVTILLLPFMSNVERKRNWNLVFIRFKLIFQVLFEIPKYDNSFNSRPYFLKVK